MKIPGLEKWRFLHSVSGQVTCSRIERQRVTGSLPGREMASGSLQQENYKGWIRKRGSLGFFFYFVLLL